MNPTKTERDQWRERLLSPYTCFDAAHADFTIRLLDALDEAEADRRRLERKESWLASQLAAVDSSCPLPENYPCKYHCLDNCKTYDGILRTSCWKKAANEVFRKAEEEGR